MRISHYSDITVSAMLSQIAGVLIICSTVCSGAHQRKCHSSASLAIVRGLHHWLVDSPHKGPVMHNHVQRDFYLLLCWLLLASIIVQWSSWGHSLQLPIKIAPAIILAYRLSTVMPGHTQTGQGTKCCQTQGSFCVWAQPMRDDVTL